MVSSYAPIARRAAARLASDFDPELPAYTERVLAQGGETTRSRSFDAGVSIALAALLLSAVQFGWQIYRDLKEDREKDKEERLDQRQTRLVLMRRMRLSLGEPSGLTSQQRDRLLEVVAEEILASDDLPE